MTEPDYRKTINDRLAEIYRTAKSITVSRALLQLCDDDYPSAVLLNQILFWTGRTSNEDGWIVKSYAEWKSELGLSKKQVMLATKKLKARFGLETTRKKSQFKAHQYSPVVHYRLSKPLFENSLIPPIPKIEDTPFF